VLRKRGKSSIKNRGREGDEIEKSKNKEKSDKTIKGSESRKNRRYSKRVSANNTAKRYYPGGSTRTESSKYEKGN